jgi:hypothetical protein
MGSQLMMSYVMLFLERREFVPEDLRNKNKLSTQDPSTVDIVVCCRICGERVGIISLMDKTTRLYRFKFWVTDKIMLEHGG